MAYGRHGVSNKNGLPNDPNIIGFGTGIKQVKGIRTSQPATVVFVKRKLPRNELLRGNRIPDYINGRITDVIEVGELRLHGRTELVRPAQPGMSMGHYLVTAGTFGAVVRDRVSGETLILSNNHVLANLTNGEDDRAQPGDPILQPGSYDGGKECDVIAKLERFVPIICAKTKPRCPIALQFMSMFNRFLKIVKPNYQIQVVHQSSKLNLVDCAVAKPLNAENVLADIYEIGPIRGVQQAQVGMKIKKSGRTTGITESFILAVDATLQIALSATDNAWFEQQIVAGPMSMPGDSGSLVLNDDNEAVGLLFAGSEQATAINSIDNVFNLLQVEF